MTTAEKIRKQRLKLIEELLQMSHPDFWIYLGVLIGTIQDKRDYREYAAGLQEASGKKDGHAVAKDLLRKIKELDEREQNQTKRDSL
jgi:hypothetical protein